MKKKLRDRHHSIDSRDKERAERDAAYKEHYESEDFQKIRKRCKERDSKKMEKALIDGSLKEREDGSNL